MGTISWGTFWRVGVFRITVGVSVLFFVLTTIAMLLYPGGTLTNPHSHGYSFFMNFLSDLGRFSALSGQSNLVSMVLFMTALSLGALGIALFFIAFTQLFTASSIALRLSRLGAGCGLVASACFLGVAGVPLDLNEQVHYLFLDAAFVSFFVAFLLIFLAVLLMPGLPRRFTVVFSTFAVVLVGYAILLVYLLFFGPAAGSLTWEIIQATGQKAIVSASILTALIQALNVPPLLLKNAESSLTRQGAVA